MTSPLEALLARCDHPAYTPGRRDFPALLGAFESPDDDVHKRVTRALMRGREAAAAAIGAALTSAAPPLRGRLARCLGRLSDEDLGPSRVAIEALLDDADANTQRAAITAIGRWQDLSPEAERRLEHRLLALWPTACLATQRALLRTLGRLGAAATEALLAGPLPEDAELSRLSAEAARFVARRTTRATPARLLPTRTLPAPVEVRLGCKPGLESLLLEELRDLGGPLSRARIDAPGRVSLPFRGPLDALFGAVGPAGTRSSSTVGPAGTRSPGARIMADLTLALPACPIGHERPDVALARLLASAPVQALLTALTEGQVRYRLAWAGPGKQKAATRATLDALATLAPAMVNDPSARLWDITAAVGPGGTRSTAAVGRGGTHLHVTLRPLLPDPRFAWRVADIPAASHPTLAAALVRLGGVSPGDRVWDPFTGSGLELVERALAGPFRHLAGTDLDPVALDAARANLASAGVSATLALTPAETWRGGPVDLILSNPPLGGRVGDKASVAALMVAFIPHVAATLAPGGRMAWLTRDPRHTDPLVAQAGLRITRAIPVDLGGVLVTMQRVEKPRQG